MKGMAMGRLFNRNFGTTRFRKSQKSKPKEKVREYIVEYKEVGTGKLIRKRIKTTTDLSHLVTK